MMKQNSSFLYVVHDNYGVVWYQTKSMGWEIDNAWWESNNLLGEMFIMSYMLKYCRTGVD